MKKLKLALNELQQKMSSDLLFSQLVEFNPKLRNELAIMLGSSATKHTNDWYTIAINLPRSYGITFTILSSITKTSATDSALSFLDHYGKINGTVKDLVETMVKNKCCNPPVVLIRKAMDSYKEEADGKIKENKVSGECIFCDHPHPSIDIYGLIDKNPLLLSELSSLLGNEADKESNWRALVNCIVEIWSDCGITSKHICIWKNKSSPTESAESMLRFYSMSKGTVSILLNAMVKCNLKAAEKLHICYLSEKKQKVQKVKLEIKPVLKPSKTKLILDKILSKSDPKPVEKLKAVEKPAEKEKNEELGIICPICLDDNKNRICIPCGHAFCSDCITECMKKHPNCPICREKIEKLNKLFL